MSYKPSLLTEKDSLYLQMLQERSRSKNNRINYNNLNENPENRQNYNYNEEDSLNNEVK
jgi:hypothetical protein